MSDFDDIMAQGNDMAMHGRSRFVVHRSVDGANSVRVRAILGEPERLPSLDDGNMTQQQWTRTCEIQTDPNLGGIRALLRGAKIIIDDVEWTIDKALENVPGMHCVTLTRYERTNQGGRRLATGG